MDFNELQTTPVWELYEKGRNYHRLTGIYTDADRNYRMYNGDQWSGAKLGGVEPVQKNFIKPIVKYKLSVIHDNLYAIVYSSQNYENRAFRKTAERICDMLNGYAGKVWENDKMDKKSREITQDAAIMGEGIIYIDFDLEQMMPHSEVIDMADIYYGNENDDDIQTQPYILMRKRVAQSVAIDLALSLGMSEDKARYIVGDNDVFDESGDAAKYEVNNNVTVVYKLYKKNKSVHFSVATRFVTIVEDEDLGISLYPVAHFNWERKKGSARGEGEVKNLIPNQIEVNRTEMRRVLTVKEQAYPIRVVDTSKISNPHELENAGATIKTNGQPVDDVHKIIGIVPPAQMSNDVVKLQEDLIQMTRDLAGAGDTATGEVNPEDASGRAILAVQQAQRAPVTEQKDGFKDTIEDIAKIYLEYLIVHSVNGINLEEKVTDEMTGEETVQLVNVEQSALEQLKASVKIDVTPKGAFDKFAQEQTIENLLINGLLSPERLGELKAYVKALPDDSVAPKVKLEEIIEYAEQEQLKIAKINARARLMQQRAQQFLAEDPDGQASQIAEAQMELEAQMAAEEEEYAAQEEELDEQVETEDEEE